MIATYLVKEGHEVTIIDKLVFSKSSLLHLYFFKNFKFIHGNVLDKTLIKKNLKNKDFIIPLAALVGAPLCDKHPRLTKLLNVEAIRTICKLSNIKQRIIYLTSNSGYGIGKKDKYCDENSPLNPVSLYGRTKNDAEKIVHDVLNVFMLTGFTNDTKQYFMKSSPVRPGDFLEFFAETDLLGVLSACPGGDCGSEHSSDVAKCYPLKVSIWDVDKKFLEGIRNSKISSYNRDHGLTD